MLRIARNLFASVTLIVLLAGVGACGSGTAAASSGVPTFEVNPFWPQPLPNSWVIGQPLGLHVDSRDHIWIVQNPGTVSRFETGAAQNPPASECCVPAPPVIEFDSDGNVVQAWGGPGDGYVWPTGAHGIFVDHNNYVWIGAYNGSHVLKFTTDGRYVLTIGDPASPGGSNDPNRLDGPAGLHVSPETNELFVSDGYGNRRVIVFDAETGEYLRHWGAYGERPSDADLGNYDPDGPPARQFRNAHGLVLSHDGLIYVADRGNNRIQVFERSGEFVMERIIAPRTRGSGAAFDVALSRDPQQRLLYVADGSNMKVWILRREDLEVVGEFGSGGRQVGQFTRVHNLDVDSQGNVYTTEAADLKRVQKFAVRGMLPQ